MNPAIVGDAVLFYDFNDASDTAKDITGNGNNGEVIDAEYSGDGDGRTGKPGEPAMDSGDCINDAYVDIVNAKDGAFESLTENDMATLTMWIYGNDEQLRSSCLNRLLRSSRACDQQHAKR